MKGDSKRTREDAQYLSHSTRTVKTQGDAVRTRWQWGKHTRTGNSQCWHRFGERVWPLRKTISQLLKRWSRVPVWPGYASKTAETSPWMLLAALLKVAKTRVRKFLPHHQVTTEVLDQRLWPYTVKNTVLTKVVLKSKQPSKKKVLSKCWE